MQAVQGLESVLIVPHADFANYYTMPQHTLNSY